MPRMRQRRSRDRRGYTAEDFAFLLTGCTASDVVMPYDPLGAFFSELQHSDKAAREAWESMRETLLPQFIADNPSRRPWAWWQFDAPELRRRIDGIHPFKNPKRRAHCVRAGIPEAEANEIHFGRPSCLIPSEDFDDFDAEYESDADYLERLHLLTRDER